MSKIPKQSQLTVVGQYPLRYSNYKSFCVITVVMAQLFPSHIIQFHLIRTLAPAGTSQAGEATQLTWFQ